MDDSDNMYDELTECFISGDAEGSRSIISRLTPHLLFLDGFLASPLRSHDHDRLYRTFQEIHTLHTFNIAYDYYPMIFDRDLMMKIAANSIIEGDMELLKRVLYYIPEELYHKIETTEEADKVIKDYMLTHRNIVMQLYDYIRFLFY